MAEFGIIGLETAFAVANTFRKDLDLVQLIEKLTTNPRKILKINQPKIAVGEIANLTLFAPEQTWTYRLQDVQSQSKNSPFLGKELKGKVLGVFNKKQQKLFV
jgi:dihydroorotase